VQVVHVEDVIAALGLRSPFDDETVIPDLMRVFQQSLMLTPMFREYNEQARLFRQGNTCINDEWDLNKVSKAVNMVLGAAGLKLKPGKEKRTGKEAERKQLTSDYRLDAEGVAEMVELVKLRLRVSGLVPVNEHARGRLEACEMPRYGHLVGGTEEGESKRACLFRDEEGDD
jgi:hypothetical protein